MAIVSLLPHVTSIVIGDSVTFIDPSGTVARCSQTEETVGEVDGIPLTRQTFGAVTGLPAPEEGTWFLVSRMVASALPDRHDLVIPGPLVRDEKGVVVGCRGLSVI